jgi:hypothetical protein
MTNLTGQTPYATYRDILTTTNGGQGLPEETLVTVQDGAGNDSPMLMSRNAVQFTKMMVIPCWTTEERPRDPLMGTLGYNISKGAIQFYNGESWSNDE